MAEYVNLQMIKRFLDIEDDDSDGILLTLIKAASNSIDKFCNRTFALNTSSVARYFDGKASNVLFHDDLLTLTTLKFDRDGDGTYEETISATEPILYPANKTPKTYMKLRTEAFPVGNQAVEITGVWGYASAVPDDIVQACIMQVSRLYKRKDTGYAMLIASPELGQYEIYRGIDPDVKMMLMPYKKLAGGS